MARAWRDVAWREGVDKTLHSRFAVLRVRPAHRDYWRSQPHSEEWLLVEWPQGESAPTKYWLSTLPADADLATLVAAAKMRWRIERDGIVTLPCEECERTTPQRFFQAAATTSCHVLIAAMRSTRCD